MKKKIIIILIFIIVIVGSTIGVHKYQDYKYKKEEQEEKQKENQEIINVFNEISKGQVFLNTNATEEEIKLVQEELENVDYIYDIIYISKEEALEEMKESFKDSSYILDGYEGENNIFPNSYSFKIKIDNVDNINEEFFEKIEDELKKFESIDTVRIYNKTYLTIYENYGIDYLKAFIDGDTEKIKNLEINKK